MNLKKCIDDHWVVHRAPALSQDREGILIGHFRTVRSVRGQGVEAVNNGQNPCANWNLCSFDPTGVSGPIPIFVMVAHDWYDRIGKIDRGKDVCSYARVKLHFFKLCVRKLPRLVED